MRLEASRQQPRRREKVSFEDRKSGYEVRKNRRPVRYMKNLSRRQRGVRASHGLSQSHPDDYGLIWYGASGTMKGEWKGRRIGQATCIFVQYRWPGPGPGLRYCADGLRRGRGELGESIPKRVRERLRGLRQGFLGIIHLPRLHD